MPRKPPPEETRWKPGQSGNPAGRPPNTKYVSDYLRELLEQHDKAENMPGALAVAMAIYTEAKAGTPAAFLELLNRTEGKVPSALDLTTKGESMNADVNKQNVEHRLAALLDQIQKRVNEQ